MLGAARVMKTSSSPSLVVGETDSEAGNLETSGKGRDTEGRWQLSLEEGSLEDETPGRSARTQSPLSGLLS